MGRKRLTIAKPDRETLALCASKKFMEIINRSRKSYAERGGISSEELKKRLEFEE